MAPASRLSALPFGVSAAIAISIGPGVGLAAPAEDTVALQEIVVTAQKRAENLQEVPLSIAAFSAETLSETGTDSFSSLAARVPGVAFNDAGPGRSSYSIRGIASIGGNAPTTGFYIDETPIIPSGGDGANATIDPDLFDLARVEVLRGPQGTLYGASSMGGTVRLITNPPDPHRTEGAVKAEGSVTEHGGGNGRLDAMFNLPFMDDRAALRVVGTYKHFSGWIDRQVGVWAPNPNQDPTFPPYPVSPSTPAYVHKGVNTDELYSLRTALKFVVNDQLTITPSVWYQLLKEGGPSNYDVPTGTSGGPLVQARPFDISEAYTDRAILSNVTLNYALSFGSIISSTSFMHRVVITPDDETEALELNFPQGQFVPNSYAPRVTTREFTEELRLAITPEGSAFNAVVGTYYNDANRHYSVNYLTPNYATLFANTYTTQTLLSGVQLSDVNYSQSGDYAPKQYAVFAEGNYNITAQLKLTAGLRWYDLEYTTIRHEDGWSNGGPSLSQGAAKNTGINPKVSVSYEFNTDTLTYATASRGVRPGGVNTSNLAAKGCGQDYGPYEPDSLWNYEVGGKTRWFGGALIANGAAYYIKWKKVQQGETLPCSYQITTNAGEATVRGGELELEGQIGRHLLLTGGAAYTKATLDQDAPNLNGVAGEQLQNVPLWNANASARYSFQPAPDVDAFARIDARYVGTSYPDFSRQDTASFQRSYSIFDLRAGIIRNSWEADIFLDNVTDKQAAISRFISDNYDAASRSRLFTNRPRTLGLSIERRF